VLLFTDPVRLEKGGGRNDQQAFDAVAVGNMGGSKLTPRLFKQTNSLERKNERKRSN
jgi:hypothetical protein